MKNIIKNTLILTAITVVSGSLLGVVYNITKDPIAAAQENAKQEAFRSVLSEASSFESYSSFDVESAAAFLGEIGSTDDITEVVQGISESGDPVGYVVNVTSHSGYGGDIQISVGILEDGTVQGIEMLSISETAGLGMKAKESTFKDQFAGKHVAQFAYTKTGESGEDKINAISGATITTNAVTNAVNSALSYFQNEIGGGINE